jgi:hypothetical protein
VNVFPGCWPTPPSVRIGRNDFCAGVRDEGRVDKINLGFVLGNKVAFGSVNANREYFEAGVKYLSTAELQYPGWLKKLLTHPVKGLENFAEMIRLLTETKGAFKVYCEVAAIQGAQSATAAG